MQHVLMNLLTKQQHKCSKQELLLTRICTCECMYYALTEVNVLAVTSSTSYSAWLVRAVLLVCQVVAAYIKGSLSGKFYVLSCYCVILIKWNCVLITQKIFRMIN